MRIFEAYDDTSIRILFKGFIEAEGVSVSKREQTYTRFGTYMSRIRGVLFDRMLLEAKDEEEFRDKLNHIFHDKWKNHLGYPEMPDYFFRYLDFLHTLNAMRDDIVIEGLAVDDDSCIRAGKLSRFEERFMSADGKLRILANPSLILRLKEIGEWKMPVSGIAIDICEDFYAETPVSMSRADWKSLLEDILKPKKKTTKRGDISFEIKDKSGETKICNSTQAMELIVNLVGIERISQCNLKLNGQPIVTKRVPKGKETTFKDMGNGWFLNNMGVVMDRFKVMRVLISLYRLPLEINLSKETATKTPRKLKKAVSRDLSSINQPAKQCQPGEEVAKEPIIENPITRDDEDFVFGSDGTLNLFDDF